jgi:hypothetical protein
MDRRSGTSAADAMRIAVTAVALTYPGPSENRISSRIAAGTIRDARGRIGS